MINQQIDKVQMELDKAQEVKEENTKQETAKYGSYDIPKWSLPYIINGDASGLSDKEQELVDKFLDQTSLMDSFQKWRRGKTKRSISILLSVKETRMLLQEEVNRLTLQLIRLL